MAVYLDVCRFTPTLGGTTDWTFSSAVTGYQSPTAAGAVNGRIYKYRAESADLSQWELGEGAYTSGVFARTTVLFNSLGTTAKVSFSTVPQVAIVALEEDLRYVPTEADFGGRLTALSAAPVPNVDVIGSQNIYLAPYRGKATPTYSNGVWSLTQFTASRTDQVGWTLNMGGNANFPADSLWDIFATPAGLAARQWDAGMLPTEVLITPVSTVATPGTTAGYITTGTTPNAWTSPGNAFNGTTSQLAAAAAVTSGTNTGAAPVTFLGQYWGTGNAKTISKVVLYAPSDAWFYGQDIAAFTFWIYGSNDNTNWHLINVTRCNDTVAAGQVVTIPISVSEQLPYLYHRVGFDNNQTGGTTAHNNRCAQVQFFNKVAPANGRRLTLIDGFYVNDAAIATARTGPTATVAIAQYEGVYRGTVHIDTATAGQVTQHMNVTGGPARVNGIWNNNNQVPIKLSAFSYAPVASYTPVTSQLWNQIESAVTGGGGITIQATMGLDQPIVVNLKRNVYLNAVTAVCSYEAGIGVDTALSYSGMEASCNQDNTGQAIGHTPYGFVVVPPVPGVRNLFGIERQGNNGAGPQSASTGPRNSHFTAEYMG